MSKFFFTFTDGEMISETAGFSITLAEVLSTDNVAFVDPTYIDKNFKNNRDKFLVRIDIYRVLQNMMSNLPIRELNRIPRFTEEGRFRPFGNVAFESNPLLDVRVTDDPSLSRLLHNSQMRKSDLMKLYIWVKSLKRFLETKYKIQIPDAKATPEAFDSVDNILVLLKDFDVE